MDSYAAIQSGLTRRLEDTPSEVRQLCRTGRLVAGWRRSSSRDWRPGRRQSTHPSP